MTDSHSLSVLAFHGLEVIDSLTYEELREMCSDWVYAQKQYRKCSRCPNYADAEYDMAEVDGELICWECIKALTEERLDEDMSRFFAQLWRTGG